MAREKKATGDAPKKRTSRSKAPVAASPSPVTGSEQTLEVASSGNNGGSRANQAINIGDEMIRRRAYEIWEQRGCQHGKDADDWYRAESEIRSKSA
jgi:hypothetical protein